MVPLAHSEDYPLGIKECRDHLLGPAVLGLGIDRARLALWQPLLRLLLCLRCVERKADLSTVTILSNIARDHRQKLLASAHPLLFLV
jgi:hypothetical protein